MLLIAAALYLATQLFLAPTSAESTTELHIGTVTVRVIEVFDPTKPSEAKRIFMWANRLHVKTRESWVGRELLFQPGDRFRPELLAETERNLRQFRFLRKVQVVAQPPRDGRVDVSVLVQDAWTLQFEIDFKREGGRNSARAGIAEHNLFGTGRTVVAFYRQGAGAIKRTLAFRDPHLLGRKLDLSGGYAEDATGHRDRP